MLSLEPKSVSVIKTDEVSKRLFATDDVASDLSDLFVCLGCEQENSHKLQYNVLMIRAAFTVTNIPQLLLFYNLSIQIEVFGIVNLYINKAPNGGVLRTGINQHLVIYLWRIVFGTAGKVAAFQFID